MVRGRCVLPPSVAYCKIQAAIPVTFLTVKLEP